MALLRLASRAGRQVVARAAVGGRGLERGAPTTTGTPASAAESYRALRGIWAGDTRSPNRSRISAAAAAAPGRRASTNVGRSTSGV